MLFWIISGLSFLDKETRTIQHYVIDRIIIENGTCWIIDYKTSEPDWMDNETLPDFLTSEASHYETQLMKYAQALQVMPQFAPYRKNIRCALYFPLIPYFLIYDCLF